MKTPHRRRWTWRLVGGLLVFLACVVFTPSAARAGCGGARGATGGRAHLEALALAGGLGPTTDATSGKLPEDPPPCPGGICSSGPSTPPAPGVSLGDRIPQWAALTDPSAPRRDGPTPLPRDDDDGRPDRHGPSLFHPPRPA